jgi:hypothetical protein
VTGENCGTAIFAGFFMALLFLVCLRAGLADFPVSLFVLAFFDAAGLTATAGARKTPDPFLVGDTSAASWLEEFDRGEGVACVFCFDVLDRDIDEAALPEDAASPEEDAELELPDADDADDSAAPDNAAPDKTPSSDPPTTSLH